jgi:phosphate starvation-inducible protein PhoH and related proteins
MESASYPRNGYDGDVDMPPGWRRRADGKQVAEALPGRLMTSIETPDGAGVPVRAQTRISVSDPKIMVNLLGAGDEILRLIERAMVSDVHVRGNEITITGTPADNALAERLFSELIELIEKGETLTVDAVRRTVAMLEQDTSERPAEVLTLNILSRRGRTIRPKTLGQKRYVDAIDQNTIVFGIGPAGTGKTYLAMAKAVQALQAKQVNRIILTRPAVEAGERLGFLPGTLNEKIDPYLRPLYDALHDMLDPDSIPRLMQNGTIEVAPLAYMRGRTLNDAFILLDEAQNTTPEQMKMFLTRLGFGAKIVVTGDVTQIDLPTGATSGLRVVREILGNVEDVHFAELTSADVVRHRLVSEIVDAYARYDARQQQSVHAVPGRAASGRAGRRR